MTSSREKKKLQVLEDFNEFKEVKKEHKECSVITQVASVTFGHGHLLCHRLFCPALKLH